MSVHGDEGGPSSLPSAPSYAGPWSQVKPALDGTIHDYVVHTLGFSQMTPVQSSVIPLFLSHRDVIVEAVTGSGKTLAYALPVLQMIMRRNRDQDSRLRRSQVGALVICPTRELAIQVHGVFGSFIRSYQCDEEDGSGAEGEKEEKGDFPVSNALLAVGGSASTPAEDYKRFREQGSDIIIGTPGRVEELLKHPGVDVKELEVLILDEADRLLDLGFSLILQSILQFLPKQRRTGLFSATMSDALGELARIGLRNPVRVVVKVESKRSKGSLEKSEDRRTPASLQNYFLICQAESKMLQLIRLLRKESLNPEPRSSAVRKAIVYFSTCAQVNYFYKVLSKVEELKGFGLYSLHGQQTPSRRSATFESFVAATPIGSASAASEEVASVLLCTDVAARGLYLPNVDLVVQFDPPTDPKVFSHRCGRTARAGRLGRAVVLLLEGREEDYVNFLRIRKSPVQAYPHLALSEKGGREGVDSEGRGGKVSEAQELTNQMRTIVRQDRDLFELGVKAFVSFVKCYKKHEANFIFREKDLDFGGVASSFALLRLPRMPEIDRWRKGHGGLENDNFHEEVVDMDKYAYADKSREKQRLEALERKQEEKRREVEARKSDPSSVPLSVKRKMRGTQASESAWSVQKAKKERKEERREKKQAKRAFEKKQRQDEEQQQQQQREQLNGKSSGMLDDAGDDIDDEEWAQEEREVKKARKIKGNSTSMTSEASFQDL